MLKGKVGELNNEETLPQLRSRMEAVLHRATYSARSGATENDFATAICVPRDRAITAVIYLIDVKCIMRLILKTPNVALQRTL